MRDKCNLIKDILPLYVEDMVSADTREFVSEHLEHCAECHAEFERMQKATKFIPDTDPDTDIVPLKRVKRDVISDTGPVICFFKNFCDLFETQFSKNPKHKNFLIWFG